MSAVDMNHWNWHEHLMSPSFTPLKAQKSGNRERIIEAAIELMNRKGSNIERLKLPSIRVSARAILLPFRQFLRNRFGSGAAFAR
jgi:hypothetical protein